MRARRRSRAGEAEAASVEDEEAVGDATVHAVGNCGIAESFALGEMIGGEDFVWRKHRRHREAAALRLERQLDFGLVLEEFGVQRIENVGLNLHAAQQKIEVIGLHDLRLAEPRAHRAPLPPIQNDQADEAVSARIHRVDRCVAGAQFEVLAARRFRRAETRHRPVGSLGRSFHDRDVEMIAASGPGAIVQRHDGREGCGSARDVGGERAGRQQRRLVRRAGAEEQAGHRDEHGVGHVIVAIRAGQAEGSDRGDDQLRMTLEDLATIQIERAIGFDPHVGAVEQGLESAATVRGIHVEGDAFFAEVADGEIEAGVIVKRSHAWRDAAPPGGSTQITSAPRSASKRPHRPQA